MQPRYLLDTNICIYISKYHPLHVRRRFEQAVPDELAMSAVSYGELRYGAEKSQQRDKALVILHALIETIIILPLPGEAGVKYGQIRAALERAGTPIGSNDLWIAAHALAENLILVTNNEREFARINGLRIENWTS